ncbi:A24 family peptidase [Enterovirga rhinocerotis]|uniref:Prepilin peptidase CpaA n=1 Tax=Enterovirga rhinocerotis TaxID=1339210 RepID=A0A4R7C8U7_9HYPH|nr:prepilin peptidase [Enterovirga rhinocerotis]TDR94693.1 prepilin peptidase CpaA [Enterovirga rhinocerotis]
MTEALILVFFPLLMAYAASSDLFTMTIPNRLALLLVGAFPVMAWLAGLSLEATLLHLAAGVLVLAITFGMFAAGWIGGGDAKLAAASALWLGFGVLFEYLLIAAVAGGFLTLALLAIRRVPLPGFASRWPWLLHLHDQKTGVPYGIALAGAALAVYPSSEIWLSALSG